jgi:flagellar hook-associated protein 2
MAAVTFSGFNNIDFNSVVSAIMAQERQPLTTLETQKTAYETQKTAFGTLAGRLSAVQSAVETLASGNAVAGLAVTSSDTSVGVASTGGSVEGSYEIVVQALARRQVTASMSTYASTDEIVATGGSLTLTGSDGTTTTITVDAVMTVKELVDAINSADAPVTASLVQSAPGAYQIVLTGRHTGANQAFTIANSLAGGTGLSFSDADVNGVYDNVQDARNATFTVNGLAIESASNTISDAVPGATLTLTKADPDKPVGVTVTRDTAAAKERVEKLITAYNELVTFINDQRTAASTGKTSIARDPLVQGLKNSVRAALLDVYDNGGSYSRLAEVGIGFDQTGKMTLDKKTFENAVSENLGSLQTLFAGDDGRSGAFGALGALMKNYTRAGGLVADVRNRLTDQTRALTSRMDALEAQLERRRLTLQREFQAADEAMSQLNAQVASLSSLGGQYRLI